MKCRVCGDEAVIKLPSHHTAFCREHFDDFFLRRVDKTIREFEMFAHGERVIAAVSGGKDSMALWRALMELGYETEGIFIDLAIEPNSALAREKCEHFAAQNNAKLHIVDIYEYIGASIAQVAQVTPKPICAVCGMIKRYILNHKAKELGGKAIATGHNLDDEAARLLGNVLHWQNSHISRQFPVLEEYDGMTRKVKPLIRCSEKETLAYAIVKDIGYDNRQCPFSKGATSLTYKHILNLLESEMPGTKLAFLNGFYSETIHHFTDEREKIDLQQCRECGYPTSAGNTCAFCRLKAKLEQRCATSP